MEINVNCPDWIHLQRLSDSGQEPVSDTKKRLYINVDKNAAICFRCGFRARDVRPLLAKLRLSHRMQSPPDPPSGGLKLPKEFESTFALTKTGRKAKQFLLARHIDPIVIAAYNLGYCETGRYANRIIIPMYEQGDLKYFQARTFLDEEPRYIGASKKAGADASILFNLERAAQSRVIVITEGPLDALRLPRYAISLQGSDSKWNDVRREKIIAANPAIVLLALDSDDAGRAATDTIRRSLQGLAFEVAGLDLPGKDVGELTPGQCSDVERLCVSFQEASGNAPSGDEHPPKG